MSDVSAILELPYLQPSQAQKHVTHNEALRLLDILVQLSVIDRGRVTPPTEAAAGDRHIVGADATGDWAGHDHQIAMFEAGTWQFVDPKPGWRAEILKEAISAVFDGFEWLLRDVAVGTVSQVEGAPTGATIERGSNASGEFVRYADGTLMCWWALLTSATSDVTWTYPAAFAGATPPRVFATPVSAANGLRGTVIRNKTTASVAVATFNSTSARVVNYVDLLAVGRWF